jgi:glycerophosphoryl diester phosphodiesterase
MELLRGDRDVVRIGRRGAAARAPENRLAAVAVHVWTVNEPGLVKTLVESGADGIITDDPRLF